MQATAVLDTPEYLHKINEWGETAVTTIHLQKAIVTQYAIVIDAPLDGHGESTVTLEVNAVAH